MTDQESKNLQEHTNNLKVGGERAYQVLSEVLSDLEEEGEVSKLTKARIFNTLVVLEHCGCGEKTTDK
jgi:hypothetical protein